MAKEKNSFLFNPRKHFIHDEDAQMLVGPDLAEFKKPKSPQRALAKEYDTDARFGFHVSGLCLQAQNGLRIIALNENWPGSEKITPIDMYGGKKPMELRYAYQAEYEMSCFALTYSLALLNGIKEDDKKPDDQKMDPKLLHQHFMSSQNARASGFSFVVDAQKKLENLKFEKASLCLKEYIDSRPALEGQYTPVESYTRLLNNGPTLSLHVL